MISTAIDSTKTEFFPTYSKKVKLPGLDIIAPLPGTKMAKIPSPLYQPTPSHVYSAPTLTNIISIPETPNNNNNTPFSQYESPSTNKSSPISNASSTPSINHNVSFKPSPKQQPLRQSNAWSYEDDLLLKYLKEVRNLGWREISTHFQNRTANGCQFRWRRINALSKTTNSSIIILSERPSPVYHQFGLQTPPPPPLPPHSAPVPAYYPLQTYHHSHIHQQQPLLHHPVPISHPPSTPQHTFNYSTHEEYGLSVPFNNEVHYRTPPQFAQIQPQSRAGSLNLILN
ncbi:hypothetical protein WICPIJ_003857 [Wickerhamomyces pijperi]|uniref:Myb-like domain-containing protein n=1 Tax=Wickerhamomyces pijperi TaxID=599730 RepID=A0A9P8Q940_WICPI|nr:hypothetical protein WICPIJ_003857 [Wickerhamomyces pijperi]